MTDPQSSGETGRPRADETIALAFMKESGDDLRRMASLIEAAAQEGLASLSDLTLPLSTGDLKEFPRPRPDLQAAAVGVQYLRETIDRAVASLHALAAARDQGIEVPEILLAAVQPFMAAAARK